MRRWEEFEVGSNHPRRYGNLLQMSAGLVEQQWDSIS